MIRLADSDFWIDASSTGWWLYWVVRERGKPRQVERAGPFTSPRHALQQRVVELPEDVQVKLVGLADLTDPDQAIQDAMPPASGSASGPIGQDPVPPH